MKGQNAHRVTANPEEHCVPKADQTADTQCDVQTHSGQGQNDSTGDQCDRKRLIRDQRPYRQPDQPGKYNPIHNPFRDHARAPYRPVGRQIRTRLIRM